MTTQPSTQQAPPAKKPRFFYGWIIVAVSAMGDMMSYSAGNASMSTFLVPMNKELGWSRVIFSGAATMQSILNVVISPILGRLVDRIDTRIIMITGAGVATVAYCLMGFVNEPWQFYILYALATSMGLHGTGGLVTSSIVSKWFIRMRGRALAWTSTGNQIGVMLIIPVVAYCIENFGWRAAWPMLGIGIALLLMPPVLLFMRRMPEDMGLRPDGDPPVGTLDEKGNAAPHSAPSRPDPVWGVKDAFRQRTTWMMILGGNMWSIVGGAFLVHQMPFLQDSGFTLQEASFISAFHQGCSFFAKFIWGYLAERYPVRYCLAGCFATRGLGILFLVLGGGSVWSVWAFAVVAGIGITFAPLSAQIWADYYGRRSVGAIRGSVAPFNLFTSVAGPLLAGFAFELTGSYTGAFAVFACAMFVGSALFFFAKPPGPPPTEREATNQAATA